MLSWQDREPFSPTYGCFDRTYWCWKFTDFPGSRLQEGAYALSHLYKSPASGNPLKGDPRALAWLEAALRFWTSLQRADGSFDEAYPFEHSLAATAFTGFYIGEAWLRVRNELPAPFAVKTLARAGEWLCRNDERHGVLSNHLAAAAAALDAIYRITGESRFEKRRAHFVQRIYDRQSSEGWYEEYGGADIGYQTHATFYLGRIWQTTRDPALLESLRRATTFLTHFIHPNGTLGGEYASRGTEFYFPAGFEILASALPEAALIAGFLRPHVQARTMAGLWTMDVYNFFPLLNNYLFAAECAGPSPPTAIDLPCRKTGEWFFPDAGLLVKSAPDWYAVLGISKGGTLRIHDKVNGHLAVSDCGYWARLEKGGVASSQTLNRGAHWKRDGDAWRVESWFAPVSHRLHSTWTFMAFRLFSSTVGRVPAVAYWLKARLVRVLVRPRRPLDLRLDRTVRFEAGAITVEDELTLGRGVRVSELRRGAKFSSIHMGSSRYFQFQELEPLTEEGTNYAADLNAAKAARFTWTWHAPKNGSDAP